MPNNYPTKNTARVQCVKCGKTKSLNYFYASAAPTEKSPEGVVPICKECVLQTYNPDDPNTFIPLLREADIAWVPGIYRDCYQKVIDAKKSPIGILGRYMSRMKLGQYSNFRYSQSVEAQTYYFSEETPDDPTHYGAANLPLGESYLGAVENVAARLKFPTGFSEGTSGGFVPSSVATAAPAGLQVSPANGDFEHAAGGADDSSAVVQLTQEEDQYLQLKWGTLYNRSQLLRLEKEYLQMLQDYDIHTTNQKDYLRKICIASLRYDEALATNASDEAKRWGGLYSSLTKESGLQPAQGNETQADYMDSVGVLVKMAENNDDFIPRWDTTESRDKLDMILNDYKLFVKRLVSQNDDIADRINIATQDLKAQDEVIKNKEVDSETTPNLEGDDSNPSRTVPAAPEEVDPTADIFGAYAGLDGNDDCDLTSVDPDDDDFPEKKESELNATERMHAILKGKIKSS